jgi:ankyrin repeat protein
MDCIVNVNKNGRVGTKVPEQPKTTLPSPQNPLPPQSTINSIPHQSRTLNDFVSGKNIAVMTKWDVIGPDGYTLLTRVLSENRPHDNKIQTCLKLIQSGANPNAYDGFGMLPLFWLLHSEDSVAEKKALYQMLIRLGADLTLCNKEGYTLLTEALCLDEAVEPKKALCTMLLEIGANPNAYDQFGLNPLFWVCRSKNSINEKAALCQMLIDFGADPNASDQFGQTPLFKVCQLPDSIAEKETFCRMLIDLGADLTLCNKEGYSLLTKALHLDDSIEHTKALCVMLLKIGVDPNAYDQFGQTPVMMALRMELPAAHSIQLCQLMIEVGADINKTDVAGRNVLTQMLSILERPIHTTKIVSMWLLKIEPDLLNRIDGAGYTPLTKLISLSLMNVEKVKALNEMLINAKVNINQIDGNGFTPLNKVLSSCFIEQEAELLCKQLLADPNKPGGAYQTNPLMIASAAGFFNIAALLINYKVNVNAQDAEGTTALMWASFMGHLSIVKILLQAGADIHLKNDMGQTAMTVAEQGGHNEIIEALQSHIRLQTIKADEAADQLIKEIENNKNQQKRKNKGQILPQSTARIQSLHNTPLAGLTQEASALNHAIQITTPSSLSSDLSILPSATMTAPMLTKEAKIKEQSKKYTMQYVEKNRHQSTDSVINKNSINPQKTASNLMKLMDILFEQNMKKAVSEMWFSQAQALVMNVGGLLKGSGSHFTVLFKGANYGQIVRDHGTGPGHDAGKITALSIAPLIRLLNAADKIPLEYQNDPAVKKAISENGD